MLTVAREDVLGLRLRTQQLDRGPGAGTGVLDLGVQDTGADGADWALRHRGLSLDPDDRLLLWTWRASPHVHRRADHAAVVEAAWPTSEADARKRVLGAAAPWRDAGIDALEGLERVARTLREVVDVPRPKGEVSARLTAALAAAFAKDCAACGSVHVHEIPFRTGTLRAGLALQPGTSPPVLEPAQVPVPRSAPGASAARVDAVRGYLHLLGPALPRHVAGFLDGALADVRARWPHDVVEVDVAGERRWLLAEDVPLLGPPSPGVRLLGPYDLYLQGLKDRELVVPDPAHRRVLWPALGRPGAVLAGGEVVGTWRPRASGRSLRLAVELWRPVDRDALQAEAELLAGHRGVRLEALAGL